jgi:TolB-like protein
VSIVAAHQPAAVAAAEPETTPGAATVPQPAKQAVQQLVAILPVAVDGELSEVDRDALTAELVGGLERGSFAVVAPAAVVAADDSAATCADAKCFVRVAKAVRASHVVRARVQVRDRDYDVRVELVDGKSGAVLAKSEEGCEICGIADAGTLMTSAAATLRTKLDALAKGPSVLTVRSEPADAEVTIDGEVVGITPLERPVVGGKKIVRVSKDGYIAVEREVTVVDGVAEQISFELEKVPSRLPKRPWGWVSLGVGIAGLGVGTAFAVFDDRSFEVGDACSGDNQDADGDCKRLWDTEWIVLGTTIAGATLVTLGVAVLLTTTGRRGRGKAKDKTKPSAKVGFGPGSVSVRGRF